MSRRLFFPPLLLLFACAHSTPAQDTLVFLVRHGEKAKDDPKDPSLSDEGKSRADLLAEVLRAAGVTHIFASEYRRTQMTAAPLAVALKVDIATVSSKETPRLADMIRALPPGSTALVAGHSNTVPEIALALGAEISGTELVEGEVRLFDSQYDRLFLVILSGAPGGKSRLVELHYGRSSSPDRGSQP